MAAPDRPLDHQFPVFGEGLLGKATALFSEQGVNISVDRVIAAADVAPMTLYRRFGGKDDLVVASLTLWSAQWLEALAEQVQRYGDDPQAQYEGLWEVLEQWFASADFHGSFVANAALELRGNRHHPRSRAFRSGLQRYIVRPGGRCDPGNRPGRRTVIRNRSSSS